MATLLPSLLCWISSFVSLEANQTCTKILKSSKILRPGLHVISSNLATNVLFQHRRGSGIRSQLLCKKKLFRKILQTLRKKSSLGLATLLKHRIQQKCFPLIFGKFLRTTFCRTTLNGCVSSVMEKLF